MASLSVHCPKISALFLTSAQTSPKQHQHCMVSFQSRSLALLFRSSLRVQGSKHKKSNDSKVFAQLSEVDIKESSNSALVPQTKLELPVESTVLVTVPDASPISEFMTQVADLVRLVDSRDIVELQLKQLDCELILKKKEALEQHTAAAPVAMMPPYYPQAMMPYHPPQASPPAPSASAPVPPTLSKPKSSYPPLKCPMAGTFYRAPAPGAPPFVKVGDTVQKDQVICIIEAMKLMNEIEANQSGTIVEILVDDGKPVSMDMPLFIIQP